MRFEIRSVVRPVDDTDLSDLTTAKRLGPAAWASDGVLEIPFDRPLTDAETAAIERRLTTRDGDEEQQRATLEAYLSLTSPTTAQTRDALRALIRRYLSDPA